MKWTPKQTLIAGGILILLTNIIALGGVAYNRKGTPVTVMKLSERELRLPYSSKEDLNENSGIALNLHWQSEDTYASSYRASKRIQKSNDQCEPGWLDQDKLRFLGFDVSQPASTPEGQRHYDKQLPREVFLVLELDGPAYHQSVEDARKRVAEAEALLRTESGGKKVTNPGSEENLKNLKERLEQAEKEESRLFLIDGGLDIKTLREKYPDITRYAIVRGEVGIQHITCGDKNQFSALAGWVKGLSITTINVPFRYRYLFEPIRRHSSSYYIDAERKNLPHYEVAMVYGQRLEPWIPEVFWKNNIPAGK